MQAADKVPFRPTVKFCDIDSDLIAEISTPGTQAREPGGLAPEHDSDDDDDLDTETDDGFGEYSGTPVAAATSVEVDDDIDLDSPFLLDLISPIPILQPAAYVPKCRKQPAVTEGDPNWNW